jgi:hypothetical protein
MHATSPSSTNRPGHWSTRVLSLVLVLAATGVGTRLAVAAPATSPVAPPPGVAPAVLTVQQSTVQQSTDQLLAARAHDGHGAGHDRSDG